MLCRATASVNDKINFVICISDVKPICILNFGHPVRVKSRDFCSMLLLFIILRAQAYLFQHRNNNLAT